MNDALHPLMAAILAPWTPPPRTAEEEARWVAADLARVRDENSEGYEQRRANRIERLDAPLLRAMAPRGLPGEPA